jgi:hypothetical protein
MMILLFLELIVTLNGVKKIRGITHWLFFIKKEHMVHCVVHVVRKYVEMES